jgi:uncharacterized protein YihD (DUF1040 family)
MDKSFEQFLVDEIRHIRTGVDDLTEQITDLQLKMTEYVPQAEIDALSKDIEVKFAECKSRSAENVKSLIGWIIGAYLFIMTTAITLFTTLLSKK